MREVHQAHDAEDKGKAGGEKGVEAAEEHALDKDIKPVHRACFGLGRL